MNHPIITPNLPELVGKSDDESIQNAVDFAARNGIGSVTIPSLNVRTGEHLWVLDRAVILPSDIEIVLDNCHLKQADNGFDNIFRNFENTDEEGHTLSEQKKNIVIRGVGHSILEGGVPNGLTQKTSMKDGMPNITRNSLILFYNVRDFVLENLEIRDHRYWGITLLFAERGRISQIHMQGDCHLRNQDGIDLRVGCSNILIEKITGQTGDDVIALSALGAGIYYVDGHDEDIHDVIIRDVVATSVECAVISMRNCDGRKIHDITVDNVHCNDNYAYQDGKRYPDYPAYKIKPFDICRIRRGNEPYTLLRIGQSGYFVNRDSVLGELYNIHATNLHMHMGCVIMANVALENCYFGNIYADNDVDYILTTKEGRTTQPYGADMRNVVIENVFYHNVDNDFATAFDFDINVKDKNLENVFIQKAFLGNCKKIFHIACEGKIRYRDFCGTNVKEPEGEASKTNV